MIIGTTGHFLTERIPLGTQRLRTLTLTFKRNPRRVDTRGRRVEPYAGPLVILMDGVSGSASELFAGAMQSVGRALVVGDTSMGAVLPAAMERLPNRDVLYHAFAEFITVDGIALEGRGVYPDRVVPLTREELIAGRDPAMHAALTWIKEQQ